MTSPDVSFILPGDEVDLCIPLLEKTGVLQKELKLLGLYFESVYFT